MFGMNRKHGSLYDRGCADAYYERRANPHWYPDGTYNGPAIISLCDDQIKEYMIGYNSI